MNLIIQKVLLFKTNKKENKDYMITCAAFVISIKSCVVIDLCFSVLNVFDGYHSLCAQLLWNID